ncbi:winged helix-turn-helix transcriptional regulator [Lactobacillus alvi]|uniref:Winged helix-turn-helix transcriptional regulator n=1 Tax=Limosilactobacillus alvi TaxID=990412 RepID=A0ABS2EQ02_9LACO|nr:metalloregulator ArsR/SmtB family transcription factor [Limosilactobacillus alvi]MBM6754524.1 winged helix-turn-helix transcriptional regulator [Limosilactobacillus alvi]
MKSVPFEVPKNQELDRVVTFFKAFGDRTRYLIVTILAHGPLTVNELADRLGTSQPAMSHQLMILRQAGIVVGKRDGRYIHYQLTDDHVLTILRQVQAHTTQG